MPDFDEFCLNSLPPLNSVSNLRALCLISDEDQQSVQLCQCRKPPIPVTCPALPFQRTRRIRSVTVPCLSVKAVTLVFILTQRVNTRTQPIHSLCYKGNMPGMLLWFTNWLPSKCSFIFHANKYGKKKSSTIWTSDEINFLFSKLHWEIQFQVLEGARLGNSASLS